MVMENFISADLEVSTGNSISKFTDLAMNEFYIY